MKLAFETENLEVYGTRVTRKGQNLPIHVYFAFAEKDSACVYAHAVVTRRNSNWAELWYLEPSQTYREASQVILDGDPLLEFANGLEKHLGTPLYMQTWGEESREFLERWGTEHELDTDMKYSR